MIFNDILINLNIHISQTIYGNNIRNFDIMDGVNFLLSYYRESLNEMFEIGKDMECYKSNEELKEKVEFYLKNQNKVNEIALNGYNKIIKKHIYKIRMGNIVNDLNF